MGYFIYYCVTVVDCIHGYFMWVYTMPKILFAAKLIFGMHVVIDIADSRNSKHYATKWVPTLLLTPHSYIVIIHDGLVYSWNA